MLPRPPPHLVPFRSRGLENADAAHVERISGHLVSLEYFSTLGARPLLGRFFDPDLERRGGPPTAVVSERFWRMRLNGDSRHRPRGLDQPAAGHNRWCR
jgi:putative ABC transport system permease protein